MKKIVFWIFLVLSCFDLFGQVWGFDAYESVIRNEKGAWTSNMAWSESKDVVVLWNTLRIEVLGENGEREVYDIIKDSVSVEKKIEGSKYGYSYWVRNERGLKWRAEITIFIIPIGMQTAELILKHGDFNMGYKLSKR